jgi:lysozyme
MAGPPEVHRGLTITKAEADDLLALDLGKYEKAVSDLLTKEPTENQFAAMVSLCYNIGPGNFAKSTVCKAFNAGKIGESADAFRRWNKAGGKILNGLVRRREAERALFLKTTNEA